VRHPDLCRVCNRKLVGAPGQLCQCGRVVELLTPAHGELRYHGSSEPIKPLYQVKFVR
jgi:hypothetical protein